ncbi:MAG: SpoIIE family protein phosphatase [Phycisphaeraceae bacterium]|nr:SpoIIE family protein phosphatase [Phycisphaeraceae bacterium]
MSDARPAISLLTTDGPEHFSRTLSPDRPYSIGRLRDSDICLLHENVSRQHACITHTAGAWYIVDLASKWGTFLNGIRLTPQLPVPLVGSDLVRIGPWTFRVSGPVTSRSPVTRHTTTFDDKADAAHRVQAAPTTLSAARADRRLNLIIESMSRLAGSTDELQLARSALELLISGSGFARAAALRVADTSNEVDVIAAASLRPGPNGDRVELLPDDQLESEGFRFSRSLLKEASRGQAAVLTAAQAQIPSNSIHEMHIHSALCLPITLDETVVGYLYLDARGRENRVQSEAVAFCEAITWAYCMALGNIKRVEQAARERILTAELMSARAVQEYLTPNLERDLGQYHYAGRIEPGLFVAGDIFDVIPLPGGAFAVLVGDASGHGAAAGMQMAAVQSHLNADLRRGVALPEAVAGLNRYLFERALSGRFVTLWAGVFDGSDTIRYVDAGHGLWMIRALDATIRHGVDIGLPRGVPLGIDATSVYEVGQIPLHTGESLILYTDGLTEQRDSRGEQFRRHRLGQIVAAADSPAGMVQRVFETVVDFSGPIRLKDDATIVSIFRTK